MTISWPFDVGILPQSQSTGEWQRGQDARRPINCLNYPILKGK